MHSAKLNGVKAFVGITDEDWFELLGSQSGLDEANFWQPGGNRLFQALQPGELFLFKLHSPNDFIVGGGYFAHSSLLPISLAWDSFGIANGARSLEEMRTRVAKYRRVLPTPFEDHTVGCILLEEPFFWTRDAWIPVPADWKRNIVQGRGYDLETEPGRSLLEEVRLRLAAPVVMAADSARLGSGRMVLPRLGQGSFRVVVTDAYQRRCAITGERTLPVLEAAHIQSYASGGAHRVDNGLLLRSDLHTLFDRGYLTVTPDLHVEVSKRIRAEFSNGRQYYAMDGQQISVPASPYARPAPAFLRWHNEQVFRG